MIVDAARNFAKAAALYSGAADEEKTVEMNSFLYWCKKKMTKVCRTFMSANPHF